MCVVVLFPLVFPQQNMYLPSNIKMQEEKRRAKERAGQRE
jgi:hypothetical protein